MLSLILLLNMNYALSNVLPDFVTSAISIAMHEAEKDFFSQNTFIDNNCYDCRVYHGRELVDCMAYSEKKELVQVLNSMDAHSLRFYLQSMNYQDYKHFVQRLSEEEWRMVFDKLSLRESEFFPETVKGQIEMLQEMYLKAVETVVCSPDLNILLVGAVFASGFNLLVITGGLVAGEINDWDGKGRIEERLKSCVKDTMTFTEKNALIQQAIMNYYESSMKVGLKGLMNLHKEIDEKVDSLFNERISKLNKV